jgi:hypothetical protein
MSALRIGHLYPLLIKYTWYSFMSEAEGQSENGRIKAMKNPQ